MAPLPKLSEEWWLRNVDYTERQVKYKSRYENLAQACRDFRTQLARLEAEGKYRTPRPGARLWTPSRVKQRLCWRLAWKLFTGNMISLITLPNFAFNSNVGEHINRANDAGETGDYDDGAAERAETGVTDWRASGSDRLHLPMRENLARTSYSLEDANTKRKASSAIEVEPKRSRLGQTLENYGVNMTLNHVRLASADLQLMLIKTPRSAAVVKKRATPRWVAIKLNPMIRPQPILRDIFSISRYIWLNYRQSLS
ncbi:unnamed protein product [Periconia digitata]|uniref:Uncharacterized protein n=1 Tax=Periconia digitata TaxID=1303443 RepID=A0A9W4UDP6_9PLEO|nr:unnamed protein product [Periconia digitata]